MYPSILRLYKNVLKIKIINNKNIDINNENTKMSK